jgi:hypothetical protein
VSAVAVAQAPRWQTLSGSARGASHERTGAPNQDFAQTAAFGHGDGAIIAVADGHGDELHGRSDRGARFATEAAVAALRSWVGAATGSEDAVRDAAACLPETIVRAWRDRVFADLERDPPGAVETSLQRADKAEIIRRSPEVLYGSTLVAAAINERVAAYVQIGDGDLLAVGADNKVTRLIPGRGDVLINQTESLCQSDAPVRFRVQVDVLNGGPQPALVLAATDGYCNSYAGDEAAFFKVATDLRGYLERHGPRLVRQHIEGWLRKTSQTGSGDDITVALAWHGSAARDDGDVHNDTGWRRLLSASAIFGRWLLRVLLIVAVIAAIAASALWIARDHLPPVWKAHAIEWVNEALQKAKDVLHIGSPAGTQASRAERVLSLDGIPGWLTLAAPSAIHLRTPRGPLRIRLGRFPSTARVSAIIALTAAEN